MWPVLKRYKGKEMGVLFDTRGRQNERAEGVTESERKEKNVARWIGRPECGNSGAGKPPAVVGARYIVPVFGLRSRSSVHKSFACTDFADPLD